MVDATHSKINPESQSIEYKLKWHDDHLKWICGFANAEGGKLIVGFDDRGALVGIGDALKLMEDIPNKVRDLMGLLVTVNLKKEYPAEYLEISVEPYPHPVSLRGKYYQRTGSTNQELKGASLDRFILRRQGRHWDGVPVPGICFTDLSNESIERFRELAKRSGRISKDDLEASNSGLIERLKLKEGDYFKRASVLLFHKDPEAFVGGAFIKIGFFRSESDLVYHDEIYGDLFSQIEDCNELIRAKYFKAAISYEGIKDYINAVNEIGPKPKKTLSIGFQEDDLSEKKGVKYYLPTAAKSSRSCGRIQRLVRFNLPSWSVLV